MYFSSFYYDIDPQYIDINKNIKLPYLVTLLLNTAGRSSEEYSIGINQLMDEGKSWVLSRLAVDIKQMPLHHDHIRIDTWIEKVERMFSLRNFQIVRDGEIICQARSIFAVIDNNTRRPVNLMAEERFARLSTNCEVNIEAPTKIAPVATDALYRYTTQFSDMDFNGHCNSSRYIEWMLNAVPITLAQNLQISRFEINYLHEVMPCEQIDIAYSDNESRLTFDVRNANKDSVARALIMKL